ncbi:hypothetical protein [Pueribacillus sp. YX66]|uniref:hypothetical protein n=1 Tax=Pueribacillus sp. YX66 TaxID=3229242 RepID=UPI00358D2389
MEEGMAFASVYRSALVYLSALLVMIGLSLLFTGWLKKMMSIVWAYLLYSFTRLSWRTPSISRRDGKGFTFRLYTPSSYR